MGKSRSKRARANVRGVRRGMIFILGRARLCGRRAGNTQNTDGRDGFGETFRWRVARNAEGNLQLGLRGRLRNRGMGDMADLASAMRLVVVVTVGMPERIDAQHAYREDQRYRQQPQKERSRAHY
jgi:hypothetical protein